MRMFLCLLPQLHQHHRNKAGNSEGSSTAVPTPTLGTSGVALSTRPLSLASPDVQGGITEDAFRIIPVSDDEVSV